MLRRFRCVQVFLKNCEFKSAESTVCQGSQLPRDLSVARGEG